MLGKSDQQGNLFLIKNLKFRNVMPQSFLLSYQAIHWLTFIEKCIIREGEQTPETKEAEFMNVQLR